MFQAWLHEPGCLAVWLFGCLAGCLYGPGCAWLWLLELQAWLHSAVCLSVCPGAHCVTQAVLELRHLYASASAHRYTHTYTHTHTHTQPAKHPRSFNCLYLRSQCLAVWLSVSVALAVHGGGSLCSRPGYTGLSVCLPVCVALAVHGGG